MNGISLDTDYNLQIKDGDLLVEDTEQQNIEFIVRAQKGHFYQWPKLGVGIALYQHATVNRAVLSQEIRLQLESDNFKVNTVDISGNIDELITTIDAERLK